MKSGARKLSRHTFRRFFDRDLMANVFLIKHVIDNWRNALQTTNDFILIILPKFHELGPRTSKNCTGILPTLLHCQASHTKISEVRTEFNQMVGANGSEKML